MSRLPESSVYKVIHDSRIVVGGKYRLYVTIYEHEYTDNPTVFLNAVKRVKKMARKKKKKGC